jgi:hypothetical protein
MNKGIKYFLVFIIIVIAFGVYATFQNRKGDGKDYTEFAQCLTDKGFIMYGAEWCSYCKANIRAFGKAFEYIEYVECPENIDLCVEKGIEGYPTWISGEGQVYRGLQSMANLAAASGCVLPE